MPTPFMNDIQLALRRFRPSHPSAPANTFVYGFITPDQPPFSISIGREAAVLSVGVRDAEYLIYASSDQIAALFDADHPERAAIVEHIDMRPAYPFNNYLLSILLNGLDLAIPNLDYTAKRFDGPYPFPPRYPAAENRFRMQRYVSEPLPAYNKANLPALIADDHPLWVAMYDQAWQLAFKNLRQPEPGSGFIANFIDAAFNPSTFMWDSCFMTLFGQYGRRVFPFLGTLDNFYAKQHDDGFICREINSYSGSGVFQPLDPRSTGPNILAWTELLHYGNSGDTTRLDTIFPALIAYHRWWKDWRTHPDGSYWTSGWGSGMDNQTRVPQSEYHHRHTAWIDANFQQALNLESLLKMARLIGRHEFDAELKAELAHLQQHINTTMWDETNGFYHDRAPDGQLSTVKSIGAFWGLLTDIVPTNRAERMMAQLENEATFKRPHRVPTQAADSIDYNPYGGYWLGGVWSPTNYMILRGLTQRGAHDLAHQIALNHVENVAQVFQHSLTLWENYSPEYTQPGKPAQGNFVGWTGLSAIAIPIEYLIGLRTVRNDSSSTVHLHWDIWLIERHGVLRYPLEAANTVDLVCDARNLNTDLPRLTVSATQALTLSVESAGHSRTFNLPAGTHALSLEER
jgi:hypothetical protein